MFAAYDVICMEFLHFQTLVNPVVGVSGESGLGVTRFYRKLARARFDLLLLVGTGCLHLLVLACLLLRIGSLLVRTLLFTQGNRVLGVWGCRRS